VVGEGSGARGGAIPRLYGDAMLGTSARAEWRGEGNSRNGDGGATERSIDRIVGKDQEK
jgi:hypothetical protein